MPTRPLSLLAPHLLVNLLSDAPFCIIRSWSTTSVSLGSKSIINFVVFFFPESLLCLLLWSHLTSYKRIQNTWVPSNLKIPPGPPFCPLGLTLYSWSHHSFFIKASARLQLGSFICLFLPVEFWGSDRILQFCTFSFSPNLHSFCWYKILKSLTIS